MSLAPAPRRFLLDQFEQSLRRLPGRTVVVDADRTHTRAELDADSRQLAAALAERIPADHPRPSVVLAVSKSYDFYALVTACLRLGIPFVPLSRTWPPARRDKVLSALEPALVVHEADDPGLAERAGALATTVGALRASTASAVRPAPEDPLAYVLFTSGSTGEPKGVQTLASGLDEFAQNLAALLQLEPDREELSTIADTTFDLWVVDYVLMMLGYGALHLLHRLQVGLPLLKELSERRLTYFSAVPSVCSVILSYRRWLAPNALASLKTLCLGGAALHSATVRGMLELAPGAKVINLYGPTEASVACAGLRVDPAVDLDQPSVHVGQPFARHRFLFETPTGWSADPGEQAELFLAGPQLMAGYVGMESGLEWREVEGQSTRVYRTGDLFTSRPDGRLRFLARVGGFIKSGGYRISPDEVEAAFARCEALKESAVVAVPHPTRENLLVLYYSAPAPVEQDLLVRHAQTLLPEYCLPQEFIRLEALPRSPSGKVDYRELRARYPRR